MYTVFQQEGPENPLTIFTSESAKLALAACLQLPVSYPTEYQLLSIAFPGNPPEIIDLDAASLDYLVSEIKKGRLFNVSFRRPDDKHGLHDKYQSIRKT